MVVLISAGQDTMLLKGSLEIWLQDKILEGRVKVKEVKGEKRYYAGGRRLYFSNVPDKVIEIVDNIMN